MHSSSHANPSSTSQNLPKPIPAGSDARKRSSLQGADLTNVAAGYTPRARDVVPNPLTHHVPSTVPESPPRHLRSRYNFDVEHETTTENPAQIDEPLQVGQENAKQNSISYSSYRLSNQSHKPTHTRKRMPRNKDNVNTFDDKIYLTKKRMKVAERKVSFWKTAFHMLRHIKFKTNLTSMDCPPDLLKPMSYLELSAVYNQPREYLIHMERYKSPLERMQAAVKWMLESIVVIYRPQGMSHAKPLNPILGEIFRCEWRHSDRSITTCIVECVSHHPPVNALYFENKAHHIVFESTTQPVVRWMNTYVNTKILGEGRLHLLKTGEVYEVTFPDINVRNIFFGKSYICPDGQVEVLCQQSKLKSTFHIDSKTFKIRGRIVGEGVDGLICRINGNLQMDVHIRDYVTKKRAHILNPANIREIPMKVARLSQQGRTESRRVWYPVCYAIVKNMMRDARREKKRIEEWQRKRVAYAKPGQWKPKYFTDTGETINEEHNLNFFRFNKFHKPLMHQDELTLPWNGLVERRDKLRRVVEANPLVYPEHEIKNLDVLHKGPVRNVEEVRKDEVIDIVEHDDGSTMGSNSSQSYSSSSGTPSSLQNSSQQEGGNWISLPKSDVPWVMSGNRKTMGLNLAHVENQFVYHEEESSPSSPSETPTSVIVEDGVLRSSTDGVLVDY